MTTATTLAPPTPNHALNAALAAHGVGAVDAVGPDLTEDAVHETKTQIIAIYGKGGIGKSFTLANLSYMMVGQALPPNRSEVVSDLGSQPIRSTRLPCWAIM